MFARNSSPGTPACALKYRSAPHPATTNRACGTCARTCGHTRVMSRSAALRDGGQRMEPISPTTGSVIGATGS
jgi:hypothetical protein